MAVKPVNNAAGHLGRTMKRDREAHHWSLRAFAARIERNYTMLSQIENGHRPFNERLAEACDKEFPERRGWYTQYFFESREWTPPGFRDWRDFEDKAQVIQSWTPSVVDGMLQTREYASALMNTVRGSTADQVKARLASRMARQQRVLFRPEPPLASFVVDELALYRCVGAPEVMAAQCRHLIEVASLPHVTIQVLRAVENAVPTSSFMLADSAAFAEHTFGGYVFTEQQTVGSARMLMASITGESHTVSVSLAKIEHMERTWTGVKAATATRKAGSA